jgi:hypothetical protein
VIDFAFCGAGRFYRAAVARAVDLFRPAVLVWQAYGRAFLLIQGVALVVFAFYFVFPGFRQAAEVVAGWKEEGGIWFAALSAMVFGGVVPELLKWKLRPPGLPAPRFSELVHQISIFGIGGVMADGFYRLQARWFGDSADWNVVLLKILVDQLLYSPFVAVPIAVLWFLWREQGYDLVATWRACRWPLLKARTLQIWTTGALFWSPLLLGLYALPAALQFIAFLFALCAWGIIFVFIARRQVSGGL